ncbi:hypothetical protein CANCADRAFT_31908 [Tortispora caseinolytica NRRL Y-17796]|uniref:YbgI/family dinuclear metal center protein n=1 Tax=Tortispora caseinolytica NRRL Y-17796 TaxID=767744 RepID=A0A1E4THG0_9ASCO|nr:hypothetical protein CANCADRAFT_31908 [Tortispora caseinolytica NRRL Y-17796]
MVSLIKRAVTSFQKLYPKALADSSWDNTGLLVDSPPKIVNKLNVLLAIDLTTGVVDEALSQDVNLIIAYHPIIFRPLKSLTTSNSQQNSIIRLIQAGVSVYCPHTAIDAANGGVNDWLAKGISNSSDDKITPIISCEPQLPYHTDPGMGRIVIFKSPRSFESVISSVKSLLQMETIQIVRDGPLSKPISTVALCAGSGGSVLKDAGNVDLYFTGEFSHHESLAAVESGTWAIICGHSNTERGFLKAHLRDQLLAQFKADIDDIPVSVNVSKVDRDPLEFY